MTTEGLLDRVYLSTKEVAKVLGWNRQRAWRFVVRSGLAIRDGKNLLIPVQRLAEKYPEIVERMTFDAVRAQMEKYDSDG